MATPTKILFLEIDAGDRGLIQQWAADGSMPNIAKLMQNGLIGQIKGLQDFFVGGTWPSLYTGVMPDRHGIHSLTQLRAGTYDFYRCEVNSEIKRRPFWEYLSNAGQRVAILDVPLTGLSENINGIQTVEWGSHDSVTGFQAQPPSFKDDLLERFGRHPMQQICNYHGNSPEAYIELRDKLLEGVRKKCEITKHYLTQGNWDFFCQVFTESHCVGHQCWHLHDPSYPAYDANVAEKTGNPVKAVYTAIDSAIGEILDLVDESTKVVVLAGHGMAHKYGAQFLLPDILSALGVAVLKMPTSVDSLDRLNGIFKRTWQTLPHPVTAPLSGLRQRWRDFYEARYRTPGLPPSVGRIDLPASDCFTMDSGFPVSGIRVNMVGREPQGKIDAGSDADRFCDRLIGDLLDIVDVESGLKIVSEVRKTDDHYHGEYRHTLPDLLVVWNKEHRLGNANCGNASASHLRLYSDKMGLVEGVNNYIRTGDHRPEGMFVAKGPGMSAGQLERVHSIIDFAPTFAAMLNVELDDVDGQPIREILVK